MAREKIFIVEDEEKIIKELTNILKKYAYEVTYSLDFENIVERILEEDPKLVLLDINLPYYDGYYICRKVRKVSNVPIIVVTSRDSDIDELMSINLGADDFVTKPYNIQILLARIASLMKRTYSKKSVEIFDIRGLKYNLSKSEAEFSGRKVELTKNESRILHILFKNKEKIVSRNEIIKALWKEEEFVDDNTLTVNMNRLRKKLEEIGAVDYLQTKRGQGYMII